MIIGIQGEILKIYAMGLLGRLLEDKTTKSNILWATDAYQNFGDDYRRDKEIKPYMITGANSAVIKNRARKELEQQTERTKQHAEVFTPLWMCKKMIDHADEMWFYRADVFFVNGRPTEKVEFPKKRKWQHYVDSRRLEITCGEAPFLATRYDVLTGEVLPLDLRLGILDRKLRIINENAADEKEWLTWAVRAYQATYGYEFQGDSLLIARLNLLMTFEEYFWKRWGHKPDEAAYKKIANIIAWNIWQMDGLTGKIPYCSAQQRFLEADLFASSEADEILQPLNVQPPCRIYDWRRDNSLDFLSVNKGGSRNMKFDFIIGNPPYQEETTNIIPETNGQVRSKSIFQYFQMSVDKIADKGSILIYPGARWIHRSGKGMSKFGLDQINDPSLEKLIFYPKSQDVFPPPVAIADGISIVIKNRNKKTTGFWYSYYEGKNMINVFMSNPGEELMPLNPQNITIMSKISEKVEQHKLNYLHDRILSQKLFGIESDFAQKNPDKVKPYQPDENIDYSKIIKLFTNDKAGKAGRAKWFITDRANITTNATYIDEWQVVVSSANAGGQKRDNQLEIIDNHSAFGRSRVALASFKTEQEAKNFFKYAQTYLVKFMFLMTDEALTSLGKRVPDLIDYTNDNKMIDFSKPLDEQLFKLFDLNGNEINHIKETVDNIRKR